MVSLIRKNLVILHLDFLVWSGIYAGADERSKSCERKRLREEGERILEDGERLREEVERLCRDGKRMYLNIMMI